MGWEYRAGGGPYYIRRTKQNGVESREYFGHGPEAERAAAEDAREKAERERERMEWKQLEELDTEVTEFSKLVDFLSRGILLTEGFHQHHRGEWRKQRHADNAYAGE
jgi:hypothetical protein